MVFWENTSGELKSAEKFSKLLILNALQSYRWTLKASGLPHLEMSTPANRFHVMQVAEFPKQIKQPSNHQMINDIQCWVLWNIGNWQVSEIVQSRDCKNLIGISKLSSMWPLYRGSRSNSFRSFLASESSVEEKHSVGEGEGCRWSH